MTNELWFEKIDQALKVTNSIRNLDSWEAFESSRIIDQLKSSIEDLQDNESENLRNWVGTFETWKENLDEKSFDFALSC